MSKSFRGFINASEVNFKKSIVKNSNENGKYDLTEININNNIFLYKTNYLLNKNKSYNIIHSIDGLTFSIGLRGSMKSKSMIFENEYSCKESHINIDIVSKDDIQHEICSNKEFKALYFIIKKDFLEKYLPSGAFKDKLFKYLDNKYFFKNIYSSKNDTKTNLISREIALSPFVGELEKLYIESKALELIHYYFFNLIKQEKNIDVKGVKFTEYDINALHKAKSILLDNMKNPPSILELSKIVKLNDFKLKVGFKKLFNITPYSFLLEERMHLAKKLLENSELSVKEISEKVGYRQQQNFRKAFVNYFGILPKDVMKTRKYYY